MKTTHIQTGSNQVYKRLLYREELREEETISKYIVTTLWRARFNLNL